MTLCVQCAMRALVEGKEPPIFSESPEQHQARVHPDREQTQRERAGLEQQLAAKLRELHGS